MSHPLYNPYASGNQSSTQGQYGLSGMQAERDPRRTTTHLGPGSSFSSSSSATPASSGGMIPSLMTQPLSYRPEQSRTTIDDDLERSVDMHISRAREEVRFLSQTVHQPIGQSTRFTTTQREEFVSSGTGMTTYPVSSTSASLGHRHSDIKSGSSSMDWLPNYKRSTADDSSKFYPSPASSGYAHTGDGRFNASSERERDTQPIPGLGDYDYPVPEKPTAPTESSRPKYTSESAANILLHFGLEKEDLEHLIAYPEDQITPANLPFILRQIRIQKTKRAATADQSKPYPESRPAPSGVSGMASLSSSGGAGVRHEEMSSPLLQPSKVIDYGHTGKYTGGALDEIGGTSGRRTNSGGGGSRLLMDTYDSSSHGREPLQKDEAVVKSSALGSSRDLGSSVTSPSYSSIRSSVAPPSSDPGKRFQTQPNQNPQTIFSSYSLPKKDTDVRVFKSEASKPLPLKEPEADRQSTSKTQLPCSLFRGVYPGQPGLVHIGSSDASGAKDQSKTQGNASKIAEEMKKQQAQQQPRQQVQQQLTQQQPRQQAQQLKPKQQLQQLPRLQAQQQPKQQTQQQPTQQQPKQLTQQQLKQEVQQQPNQQAQKQPLLPRGQALVPPYFSAAQTLPIASIISSNMFIPRAPPMPVLNPVDFIRMALTPSNAQSPAKRPVSKGLPTAAKMHDYTAATPRVFPHTCSLCCKECSHMKDWISHQNTSLHIQNCTLLRAQYPEWNGEIVPAPSAAGKDAKPPPSTSAQSSQHGHQKTRHGSRSRSPSPRRHHSSDDRREKRSRSRSPHGSRFARRSRSRSRSPRYDRHTSSHSPRHRGPESRKEKRSRSRSPYASRYRSSSRSRSRSPWYDRRTSSRHRSRSRSHERRPSPRRCEDGRPSPKRSHERRPSPRRRDERRPSPRRSEDGRPSPKRSHERRSSPRRSRERRSSTERSSPQRKSSAERLAKKLLEKSAVQSLSKEADLEAVVKTLAPALLAELAKMKSSSSLSSSSSSSSSKGGKRSQLPPSFGVKSSPSSSSSSSSSSATKKKVSATTLSKAKPGLQKREASASIKTKVAKSSPPTMVKLGGVRSSLSHNDVVAAVEQFGKTKSVVLFRSKAEAIVCFEKQEDAKKLRSLKTFDMKGLSVTVKKTDTGPKDQIKKLPTSSVSTPQTSKQTTPAAPKKGLAAKGPVKGKVVVSKAKKVPAKQIGKTVKPGVQKNTVKADKPANVTDTEPTEGSESGTEVKVLASEVETTSAPQEPSTPVDSSAAVAEEKAEEAADKNTNVASTSAASESRPDVQTSQSKELETTVQETGNGTSSEPKHQADLAGFDVEAEEVKDAEPMELGETGVEVEEPMEAESCAESNGQKPTNAEALPDKSTRPDLSPPEPPTVPPENTEAAPKHSDTSPRSPQAATKTPETSVEASSQVQQSTPPAPESTAQGLETEMEASQTQQQAASSSAGAAVEAKLTKAKGVETKTTQKDPVSSAKTQRDPASAKDASKAVGDVSATSAETEPGAATTASCSAIAALTAGEMVEEHLNPKKITCLKLKTCFSPKFLSLGKRHLLIANLPKFHDGCYTEEDIAKLLIPFGFRYEDENIYVVPQARMAFLVMPSPQHVQNILKQKRDILVFKKARLRFQVVDSGITMAPLGFYKSLMKRVNFPVFDDGHKVIFIKNISPSEARSLRESLKKIGFVRNYLPLLNKVFVEFESIRDADRLGVWYSLLKQPPGHKVHRLKAPYSGCTSLPPRLAVNAMPDNGEIVAGATIPTSPCGVPQGSISPFWISMTARPFVFPTMSPWFIIPDYLTVRGHDDIVKASSQGSMFPTVMLTGLPQGDYKHEDVARLVWPYFSKQNLHSLYYNVTVLTLQRRAFVHFSDWASCCDFVRECIRNPVSVGDATLSIHFVLQYMYPESREELMYKSLMKWSNNRVPDLDSLGERLLCVEISETTVEVVKMVMKVVASIATFVSFLPLANRICVEMVDSTGVTQVVEKYNSFSPDSLSKRTTWAKVKGFESLKSLKQRLEDSREITIDLELDTVDDEANLPTQSLPDEPSDNGTKPASAEPAAPAGSDGFKSVPAGPSATATGDVAVEDHGEKLGAEPAVGSTAAPKADVNVEKADEKRGQVSPTAVDAAAGGNGAPAASSLALSTAGPVRPEDNVAELPHIDEDAFRVLKAAVHQHKLSRESRSHSEWKERSSKSNTSSRSAKDEDVPPETDDFTDDNISSDAYLFDEQSLNMEDLVTLDEVGDDGEDTSPERQSSFDFEQPSRAEKERQRPEASSAAKRTSTRSSKDSKSSATSSSRSTKDSTKGGSSSNSTSVSPKKPKDSSEPTKPFAKPSSSASVGKTSASSPETSSSPGQRAQQSKTKSPVKASNNTSSSSCRTRPSSTAREREKTASAAAVESYREEAVATEGAVAKSDHKVSAEGIAAKTVESETKIETSSEMHPPAQGQGTKPSPHKLSQAQSLETGLDNTLKDLEKSKEKRKQDDVDKHTEEEEEEEEDGENYQILDSLDDQTDEHMDDGDQVASSETQLPVPEKGPSSHKETPQVLDGVDNEGKACPKECGENKMDASSHVVDSAARDQAATGQEDLVKDDRSAVNQPSEKDETQVASNSVLDTGSRQASEGKGDGRKRKREDEEEVDVISAESCKTSEDVENDDQIPNDGGKPPEARNSTDPSKDLDSDVTEQETFEILDSIDDQAATEDDNQNLEAPTDQKSQEDIRRIEEEEDTYQVIDSVEDQPTTAETGSEADNKDNGTKKLEATAKKDDRSSRRSSPRTTAPKTEEKEISPKKQDRTVKKYETRTRKEPTAGVSRKDVKEVTVYEIVDSVEDEPAQDAAASERSSRRRSARGKREDKVASKLAEASEKPDGDEEASYEILDSVEDETSAEEPTVTTRSNRGRRERTAKRDASIEKTKKDYTPTRRRHTPARESREKTPKKEEKAPARERTPAKKGDVVRDTSEEDATYEILDSVEDDRPAAGGRGKRGRPKKEVKTNKKDAATPKKGDRDASEKAADEEEVTYQILDSVEDEMVDDHPAAEQSKRARKETFPINDEKQQDLAGSPKNEEEEEEEEEPMYQIVDSLEDEQVQEDVTTTEASSSRVEETSEKKDETRPKEETAAVEEDTPACSTTAVEGKSLNQIDLKEVTEDPPAAEESAVGKMETTSRTDVKSQSDTATPAEKKKNQTSRKSDTTAATRALGKLDEVSEEEEDYPDDTAEEEELRRRQSAAKEKQLAKEREKGREARRTREREEREQRSRSSSSRGGGGGTISGGGTRKMKERVEVDANELVTLDEVGADEAGEEAAAQGREWGGGMTEGEMQALVTLDEIVEEEEEEEEGKAERSPAEARPPGKEDESVGSLNPETLETLDEAGDDEDEKADEEKTSTSVKRKHDDDAEESVNFVTVDEVGEVEEEEEEKEEAKTRGQAKKRTRQTPARKSASGKIADATDEREEEKESAGSDAAPPASPDAASQTGNDSRQETRKPEVEGTSHGVTSAGRDPQPEQPEDQRPGGSTEKGDEDKEGGSGADVKAVNKRMGELVGPEAKRSRPESPCVAADFKLPPFKPNNPLGREFVVPKSGFFCSLCSVFYLNESSAKDLHCSSRKHFINLQKHYQKLQQTSTQMTQGSPSD